jgi:hypothetical protein
MAQMAQRKAEAEGTVEKPELEGGREKTGDRGRARIAGSGPRDPHWAASCPVAPVEAGADPFAASRFGVEVERAHRATDGPASAQSSRTRERNHVLPRSALP